MRNNKNITSPKVGDRVKIKIPYYWSGNPEYKETNSKRKKYCGLNCWFKGIIVKIYSNKEENVPLSCIIRVKGLDTNMFSFFNHVVKCK